MNDMAVIIRINGFIQRKMGPVSLDGKAVDAVALDHSCNFVDFKEPEIVLTDDQLMCLFGQTFVVGQFA